VERAARLWSARAALSFATPLLLKLLFYAVVKKHILKV